MRCAFCERIEPDRFNGTAYFIDRGDYLSLTFACAECGPDTVGRVMFLAKLRGDAKVWVLGPAHLTGKTDAVWAEYQPEVVS